ncbi:MAG: type II toxin-antitoxin system HicB family antitoxin [Clostridia bacterium]|nr:type II toxin-antitoxin system HicB family antitoxin [Clostridia bacterium]
MAKYVYPAIFTREDNGQYSVNFPDLPHCYTGGDDLADALIMANDILMMTLYELEEAGKNIPKPSETSALVLEANETAIPVACSTEEYRRAHQSRAVKKTLSIPAWLNTAAEKQNINFSQVLQEALVQRLGM